MSRRTPLDDDPELSEADWTEDSFRRDEEWLEHCRALVEKAKQGHRAAGVRLLRLAIFNLELFNLDHAIPRAPRRNPNVQRQRLTVELLRWTVELLKAIRKYPKAPAAQLLCLRPAVGRRPQYADDVTAMLEFDRLKRLAVRHVSVAIKRGEKVEAAFQQAAERLGGTGFRNQRTGKPYTQNAVKNWYYEVHGRPQRLTD